VKSSVRLLLIALCAITTITRSIQARDGHYHYNNNLVDIEVENDIKEVGRIYVQVKSPHHTTKLRVVWGIKSAHIKFAEKGKNTIYAYTSKRNRTKRFVYELELDPVATNHHIKLIPEGLIYTFSGERYGINMHTSTEGMRKKAVTYQELVNGEWRDIQ